MAFTFNGIGTSFCFARGSGDAGGDALECFVIAYLPIVPLRAVHLHSESSGLMSSKYQVVPLKSSQSLILRAYLRYWLLVPLVIGMLIAGLATWKWWKHGTIDATELTVGWALTIFCLLAYFLLWSSDKRTRQLRRILGRHEFGASDPAMWDQSVLSQVRSPKEMFAADSFMAAVPVLLEKRDYQSAMWAARLAVALEVAETAERLTDQVIQAHQSGGAIAAS